MKLRYYKDPYVYFYILGIFGLNGLIPVIGLDGDNNHFTNLKQSIMYIIDNTPKYDYIKSRIIDNDGMLIIVMEQNSDNRDSTKNNILYYCESAIFKFNDKLELKESVFNFRKTIDPSLSYATYYSDTNLFLYGDPDVNIARFLQEDCLDKELANFLLHQNTIKY